MKIYPQRAWTKDEESFVKNNFVKMSRQEMANHLKRGFYSVHRRMQKLGLKRNESLRESLIGKRFGKLVVTKFIKTEDRRSYFEVACDCGVKKVLKHTNFTMGGTTSCGCRRYEDMDGRQYQKYYRQYGWSSKKRDLLFELSFDVFKKIILQNCYYCGDIPRKISHVKMKRMDLDPHILANGIDRLKNDIGYIESNCVPCCPTCNYLKQEHNDDIFLELISKIYSYRVLKSRV